MDYNQRDLALSIQSTPYHNSCLSSSVMDESYSNVVQEVSRHILIGYRLSSTRPYPKFYDSSIGDVSLYTDSHVDNHAFIGALAILQIIDKDVSGTVNTYQTVTQPSYSVLALDQQLIS
ncbi:hypothetical protein TNCV_508711 [Trichonephila clavipes]|nr:hypothetical protein TNCV_508711 [Trichonephila clavipes]